MNNVSSIDDFTKRLMPITYLRRNLGKVIAKLLKVGYYILTKDGKPVAKLSILDDFSFGNIWEKIKLVRSFKGKKGNLSKYILKDRGSH